MSQACSILGYSRGSYCRCKELYGTGGEAALTYISKKEPIAKGRVAPEIEEAVVQMAFELPV